MPDSVLCDGVDDAIAFTAGQFVGTGARSYATILKKVGTENANVSIWKHVVSGGNETGLYLGTDNRIHTWNDAEGVDDYVTGNTELNVGDGWALVGFNKPAASDVGRFHIYFWDTTTWQHAAGLTAMTGPSAAPTAFYFANNDSNAYPHNCNLLIAGVWDRELSDSDFEALITGKAAWVALSPHEAWRFDTAAAISSFAGTSVQSARVGTTVDTGDAPTGWTDTTAPESFFVRRMRTVAR